MPIVVPTGQTPTISDFMARVRTDLFDAGQRIDEPDRWSDPDLARALDRANDKYSAEAAYIQESLIPSIPHSRLYATPAGSWFVDRVEFPHGFYPKYIQDFEERWSPLIPNPANSPPPIALRSAGGQLSAGAYSWAASFLVPGGGETLATATIAATATNAQQAVIANIPTGPYGVTDRNIYRTAAGGSIYFLLGNLGDNLATSFTDATTSDATLINNPQAPTKNSTANIAQFELSLSTALVPADSSQLLGVRYGSKHQLDANGTSLPERHWDLITLGAAMYAIMAYLVPTQDNFEYVDGQFRDRVDDTKAATAWFTLAGDYHSRFEARLKQIRDDAAAGGPHTTQWGDKPLRWDRL